MCLFSIIITMTFFFIISSSDEFLKSILGMPMRLVVEAYCRPDSGLKADGMLAVGAR